MASILKMCILIIYMIKLIDIIIINIIRQLK